MFYRLALNRGKGDQGIIILSRIVDVLIQVTLSKATAIFFRLGCALCPGGLPWTKGWHINIVLVKTTVVLRLVTLF